MNELTFTIRLVDMDVPDNAVLMAEKMLARQLFMRTPLCRFFEDQRRSFFLDRVKYCNFTPSYLIGGGNVNVKRAVIIYALFRAKVTEEDEVLLKLDHYDGVEFH